jgi:hypothetical protein
MLDPNDIARFTAKQDQMECLSRHRMTDIQEVLTDLISLYKGRHNINFPLAIRAHIETLVGQLPEPNGTPITDPLHPDQVNPDALNAMIYYLAETFLDVLMTRIGADILTDLNQPPTP